MGIENGGRVAGPLELDSDPKSPFDAVTKQYVDITHSGGSNADLDVDSEVADVSVRPGFRAALVTWSASDFVHGHGYYDVQLDTVNTFDSGSTLTEQSKGSFAVFSALQPDTTYYARVRGVRADGTVGPWVTSIPQGDTQLATSDDIQEVTADKVSAGVLQGVEIRTGTTGDYIVIYGDATNAEQDRIEFFESGVHRFTMRVFDDTFGPTLRLAAESGSAGSITLNADDTLDLFSFNGGVRMIGGPVQIEAGVGESLKLGNGSGAVDLEAAGTAGNNITSVTDHYFSGDIVYGGSVLPTPGTNMVTSDASSTVSSSENPFTSTVDGSVGLHQHRVDNHAHNISHTHTLTFA